MIFGLFGVQIAQMVADIFSFALTIPLVSGVLKTLKDNERENQLEKSVK